MQNLEFLYHYTSLDSLEKILENRTLRLSPLTQMDDLEEKEIEDLKILASFCYVSSWTYESDEKERMWEMYGDHKEGVRIGIVYKNRSWEYQDEARYIIIHSRTVPAVVIIINSGWRRALCDCRMTS